MALKLKEYRSSFDRGPPSDYLPYDSHDDGLFILKDGSLGMMWSRSFVAEEGFIGEKETRWSESRNRRRRDADSTELVYPDSSCFFVADAEPVFQNFLFIGNLADAMTKLFLDSCVSIREARQGTPRKWW